jgi:sulfate transporter 4
MDAFAENQMGRNEVGNTSMQDMTQAAAMERQLQQRRKRSSKEAIGGVEASVEVAEELLPAPSSSTLNDDKDDDDEDEDDVDVPGMSMHESAIIARRWDRRKSHLMPVADPYGEADENTSQARLLINAYCTPRSLTAAAKRFLLDTFPVLIWLPKINRSSLKADVIAGITVGVMLIPQSMSYADIAGLQYKYGLYTSVVPLISYALLGTSRQLGVGPVAMVSLLVEVGLKGVLTEEECPEYYAQKNNTALGADESEWVLQSELCPDQYAQLAFLTSFLVGIFQIGAGFLRLGFLVSFLAHPVISGFTSAAAIIIGLSQLQYFMGFKIPKSQYVYETFMHLGERIDQTKYEQVLLGLTWWFMLWGSRKLSIKYKKRMGWLKPAAPLVTCVLAIVVGGNSEIFNGCGFDKCNATVESQLLVGEIPSGLSSMGSVHLLDMSRLSTIFSAAVSCAVIGYMESIAIAKSLAAKHKYEVDAGRELTALGVANLLGSFTSAYPVTGSFSRSAVNNQVGAQTQLAGLITGLLLLITLLLLTPLFYWLPKFALAAIVISSVTNLVDYHEAIHLWKVKKQDCLLWVVAFLGTLFLGVQIGLLLAIGVSLALVIVESVRPQMTVLWRLPNTPIWRNIKQESHGHFVPGVMVVRIGASMYFANVAFIRDYISKMVKEFSEAADTSGMDTSKTALGDAGGVASADAGKWVPPEPIRYIVMEMTAVASIDSTALHMLEDMHRDLKTRDIRLAFSTVGNRVEDTLRRSGLTDKMGAHWIFPSVHVAVQHCIRHRERNNVASTDELRKSGRVQVEPAPQEAGEDEEMAATTRPPSSSSHDESEQPGRQVPGARTAAAAVDVQLDKSGGNTLNI